MKKFGRFLKRIGKITITLSALYLARIIFMFLLLQPESIGIIGGADGPTAIFLAGSLWKYPAFVVYVIILGVAAIIVGNKMIKKSEDDDNDQGNF